MVIRSWDGPPKVRERASWCPGQEAKTFEYGLR